MNSSFSFDDLIATQLAQYLAHWTSENEKLVAQQLNILVPDDQMALSPSL